MNMIINCITENIRTITIRLLMDNTSVLSIRNIIDMFTMGSKNCFYMVIHCKNKIVKITNLMVSTVARISQLVCCS